MKIIKTKDPNAIKFLNTKIQEQIEKDGVKEYNKSMILKWLRANIVLPNMGVWVAIEELKEENNVKGFDVLGFVIATIQSNLQEEFISINQILGNEDIEKELLEMVYSWAKENGIKTIMTNSRHPKRWKDYGYKVEYHILAKEVE